MKNNFKFLIVLAILLAGCICVSSTFAADISVNTIDNVSSVDNTQNIEIAHDDSSQKDVEINNLQGSQVDLQTKIDNAASGDIIDLSENYTLTSQVTINKPLTIDGKGFTIDGSGQTQVFWITATDVTIKNINFVNCNATNGGAICWNSGANGTVNNCSFTNCSSSSNGGAICWNSGANGTVNNCSFTNCSSSSNGGAICWNSGANGAVSDCNFTNSHADIGGAIYWNGANGAVSDCSFTSCSAYSGGGIYWNDSDSNMNNCSFINCSADYEGGAIYYWKYNGGNITNCSFINCSAISESSETFGGAICVLDLSNVNISGCNFINCDAISESSKTFGGAIYIHSNGLIRNCSFINCSANTQGGAINWNHAINGYIDDCNFINCTTKGNYTTYGGAICLNSNVTNSCVSNCNFTNCSVSTYGGAIYLSGTNGTVNNCSFINSTSDAYGGAIYWNGANGTVKECNFTNSYASDGGGSILWNTVANGKVINCNFNLSNTSAYGGAIYWKDTSSVTNGIVSGCNFTNSYAHNNGGVISWGAVNGTVSNCSFINSTSDANGGVISWGAVNGTVSNCSFINSNTTSISSYGGAIRWNGANGVIRDCNFINSTSNKYAGAISLWPNNGAVTNCNFTNSHADIGGSIYWKGANGTVSDCNFVNSTAEYGPTIYISGSVCITDSTCSPVAGDEKAPIYNNGTILSDVHIITLNGTNKNVTYGDSVNLTATVTTSNMTVAGGLITLKVNNTEITATSEDNGIYAAINPYTVDFVGTKPVNATYLNSTGSENVKAYNLTVIPIVLDINVSASGVYGDNITGSINTTLNGNITFTIDGKNFTGKVIDGAFVITNVTGLNARNYTDIPVSFISDDERYGGNTTVNFTLSPKPVDITVNVPDYTYGAGINGTMNYTGHEGNVTITIDGVDYNGTFDSEGNFIINDVLPVKEYTATFSFITNDGNYIGSAPVSFNVTNATGSFKISVKDSVYGSGFTINVADAVGVLGEHLNGTVIVTINNKEYTVTLTDGKGSNTTTDVLPVGEYLVSASLTVPNYNKIENSTKFNVTNATGSFKISVEDITYGDSFIINVADAVGVLGEALNGTAVVVVNGTSYEVTVTDGSGSKVTSDVLAVGEYPVNANLTVDNYDVMNATTSFNVSKVDPVVSVSVEDITYGENATVYVNVTGLAGKAVPTGNVTILVNGSEVANVSLDSGKCNYTLPVLGAGDYNITVVYNGDNNYTNIENSSNLTITPKEIDIGAVINNCTYGDDIIKGKVNAKMNGTVVIVINNGSPIYVDVDASGEFSVPIDLVAGDYSNVYIIFFSADGNYIGDDNVSFTVAKADPTISVDVGPDKPVMTDIVEGDDVVVIVTLPSDATGQVRLSIDNGKTWVYVDVINGTAKYTFKGLKAGEYTLITEYLGDDNYNGVTTQNTFVVGENPNPNPKPTPKPVNSNMENTGNPLLVLLIALCAIGLESFRRKF